MKNSVALFIDIEDFGGGLLFKFLIELQNYVLLEQY